jgi:transcriptional regulator GlxA family with amidase domain
MNHVSILAFRQALASSMTIPLEMINAASLIHSIRQKQKPSLTLMTVAEVAGPLTMTAGFTILPDACINEVERSDLIFVPALWGNPRAAVRQHQRSCSWLAEQYARGAVICSVGTGSYFLAEAGLLDNRSATTHWRYFDEFHSDYPLVKLQRKRFITHADRLYCTGSINAVRDVMLYFVEQLFSAAVADEVAHHFTHELKRSYESLLLSEDQKNSHHDEEIIKIQEWLQAHYHLQINLHDLAHQFNINVRSFNRRFRAAADKTPMQYLQEVRINQAQALLKKSNLSVSEIAFATGYQDVSYFSGLFRRINSVTPGEYRHLVRNKLFNVAADSADGKFKASAEDADN